MSARLVIVVDVDTDSTLVDPWEVAEDVVETYTEDVRHRPVPTSSVSFVSASWADSLRREVVDGLPS